MWKAQYSLYPSTACLSDRLYWAFHISKGTVFQLVAKFRPGRVLKNTKEKNQAGLQVGTMDVTTFTCTDYVVVPIT
jgi:hypothetical protein